MEGFSVILHNILFLAGMMLIGAVAVKTGYLTPENKNMLSKLIVRITLPLLIVNTLTQVELDAERMRNSTFVLITAFAVMALLYLCGMLTAKLLKLPPATALVHRCMTAFGNIVFLGYPLIQALYGADGLFYAALYAFANDLLVWTFVVWRLSSVSGEKKPTPKETLKNCLNPPTIAFIISFIMLIFGFKLSGIPKEIAQGLGGTTTYLSMLFIGGTLAEARLSDMLKCSSVLILTLTKMVIMPILLIYIMQMMPFESMVKGVIIMQVAVPAQTILSILTQEFGGDTHYVSKTIFITTLSGLATMPIIYYLLSTI